MRIPSFIALLGLLGLLGCEAEAPVAPPPAAPTAPTAEVAFDSSRFEPVRRQWTNLLTMNSGNPWGSEGPLGGNWVQAVNGLNSSAMMWPDAYARPAAAVYLQLEEGAKLDETALRAQLKPKGFTLIQLLTPADTGIERGYVLECANFR